MTMTRRDFDARRLLVILDSGIANVEHSLAIAEGALCAGCKFIQVREKSMTDQERLTLLKLIIERARRHDALVLANDRADLAILSAADGVHLGQGDISIPDARRLFAALGRDDITVGQSVHSRDQALLAQSDGADYLGCGAVYSTNTKSDAAVVGLDELASIASSVDIPLFGIGGITVDNMGDVLETGAFGVAVCNAIVAEADPGRATREFLAAIDRPHK